MITIAFLHATGDSITGTTTPFEDPDCACAAQATFSGRIEGTVIRGGFVSTRRVGGEPVRGMWEVRKRE